MKRADRKNNSDENAINYPQSQKTEPASGHELKQLLLTARSQRDDAQSQRDEWQEFAKQKEDEAKQTHHLYLEEQQKYQTSLTLYQEVQQNYQTTLTQYEEVQTQAHSYLMQYEEVQIQAKSYFTQYQEAQTQFQSYLTLYESEKTRGDELSIQFEEIQSDRDRYLTLYTEVKDELKFERNSKRAIKGWETRRKKENQRLKQEIGEMTVLLQESLARKEDAVSSLYVVAERMDRIQRLVDSVEEETDTNPIGMVQKLQRIWQTVKEILAE